MLKNSLLILLSLIVAIGGGAGSVWYALAEQHAVGSVNIGAWETFPDIGTPDADPYSRARIARAGVLTLGRAEGLSFVARRDSGGNALRRECRYAIEGRFPAARFWTLYAGDTDLYPLDANSPRTAALHSNEMLRFADNSITLSVGMSPSPGNWLPVSGTGPLALVLTLYDTPIAGDVGGSDIQLPQVLSVGCDA